MAILMGTVVSVELSIAEELPPKTKNQTSSSVTEYLAVAAKRRIESLARICCNYFRRDEGIMKPGSVLAEVELINILPAETKNETAAAAERRGNLSLKRKLTDYFWPVEEALTSPRSNLAPEIALNVDEELPLETNETASAYRSLLETARLPFSRIKRMRTRYLRPGTSGEEGEMTPGQMVVPILAQEEVTVTERPLLIAARQKIVRVKRMLTGYFWPVTLEEEREMILGSLLLANPVNEHEEETNNETLSITKVYRFVVAAAKRSIESLSNLWTRFFPRGALAEEGVMKPGSAFKFVIIGLVSFAAIKSQGETGFPFTTHPRTIMVAITSLIVLGLVSKAEHVIAHNSVCAFIARLVRNSSAYILVGSLASLFYL